MGVMRHFVDRDYINRPSCLHQPLADPLFSYTDILHSIIILLQTSRKGFYHDSRLATPERSSRQTRGGSGWRRAWTADR